ncbi:SDR family NAD(P)-dependent oxidoreductase [Candidatus Amarobacter glycogenicus]|uniref:SDR family NAD(P)-dependent oxidoreductase n=1 Tax=Candidatus Amarobacter glycogenicus TaxID=3140699 RepID=UPI002A135746|nr:SDR family NAD(P)-dependent oxidoreductase [Dehalococcoidia bacterium]
MGSPWLNASPMPASTSSSAISKPSPLAMAEAAIAARGVKVLARRTDVAKQEDVEALAKAAYERFGAVHILCNNAGIGGSPGASWELSLDDWRWVIDVDL